MVRDIWAFVVAIGTFFAVVAALLAGSLVLDYLWSWPW